MCNNRKRNTRMLNTKTEFIGIRATPTDAERIRTAAAADCRPVSSFILVTVRRHLDEIDQHAARTGAAAHPTPARATA